MKKYFTLYAIIIAVFFDINVMGQVGVNMDGSEPDSLAMLDVKSTTLGMTFPRMTSNEMNAIQDPADGLVVYNIEDHRFYFYNEDNGSWIMIATGSGTLKAGCGIVSDEDGNSYNTIIIGSQCWMVENLKTSKLSDGSDILLVTNNNDWEDLTEPGYCWYNNDSATYGSVYGALYNWFTVETGDLCPDGWHVPTNNDLITLSSFLGGDTISGGKMKEQGTTHWASPNTGATNESGFTALPGGYRYIDGTFYVVTHNFSLWSSTEYNSDSAWNGYIHYYEKSFGRTHKVKNDGFSVRCIKDNYSY